MDAGKGRKRLKKQDKWYDDVLACVIDTGVSEHPDLNVKKHIDLVSDAKDDKNGHGTHVAGIIGGTGKNQMESTKE